MVQEFVNSVQSKEERGRKYRALREAGLSSHLAREARDWRLSVIKRKFGVVIDVEE